MLSLKRNRGPLFAFIWCLANLWQPGPISAQIIDPYRRVTDPRAIADLSGDDNEPLRYVARHGLPSAKDENGYHILAQDTGAGIITHIWSTTDVADSTTALRLYVDGNLVLTSTYRDFFLKARGAFRPPLDTALAGGWVNDVQIPYREGFKITYKSPSYNIYLAIGWRRVKDKNRIKSFKLFPNSIDGREQALAEARMLAKGSPWDSTAQKIITSQISLGLDSSVVIADLVGPGMVQEMEFNPELKDPWKFHDLYLKVYYDDSPYPAIDAPLYDFFLSATKYKAINSLRIKVDPDSSMICFYPIPYYKRCRIVLENRDSTTATLYTRVAYSEEAIDRARHGYLHAVFRESTPTKLGIPHPVAHVRGAGRFIGLSHHIPKIFFAVALEGDPIITVDSNKDHFVRYTGGEDYYNGGWWFMGTLYSRPFAGFHTWFDGFYRFHFMDVMDFRQSFDFDMQHGVNNDVHDHYRTVGYYYKQWTPFWTDRDTIKFGESFVIAGSGYLPGEQLLISIDTVAIGVAQADLNGGFTRRVSLPAHFSPGKYNLKVNDHVRPEWTYVIDRPTVRALSPYQIPVLRERDTLRVTGTGFAVGEVVKMMLDSIPLNGEFVVRPDHRFYGTVRIPYLPDRDYSLVAVGAASGMAIAEYPIRIARTHNFEFEELLPAFEKTSEPLRRDNVSFFYHAKWSQQSLAYFEAAGKDSFVTFVFDVPRTDTFNVYLFATVGRNFGDYEYYIDDVSRGRCYGYVNPDYYDPWPSDTLHAGTIYLEEGLHFVTFKCLGKHDSSGRAWLGADNMVLQPKHALPPAPGTWLEPASVAPTVEVGQLALYPNPADDQVKISTMLSQHDSDMLHRPAVLTVVDPSGRVHISQLVSVQDILSQPLSVSTHSLINGKYFLKLDLLGASRSISLSAALLISR